MPIRDCLRMTTSLDDLGSLLFWRAVVGELIGTTFIVFSVCASAIGWEENYSPSNELIGLCMGFAVASMVWCLASVSGAHLNPAISLAMLVTRKVSLARSLIFITVQCAGAIIASGLVKVITPAKYQGNLGMTMIHADVTPSQGLLVELLLTFILVFTVFATCDSKRTDLNGSGPLSIGLAVAAAHLAGLKYTGCSINPARTFGPAVVTGIWEHHWVYWCGPLMGGVIAGVLYDAVFSGNASIMKAKGFLLSSKYDDKTYDANPERPAAVIVEDDEAKQPLGGAVI